MRFQLATLVFIATFLLPACGQDAPDFMAGMGPGSGMMARHHADIPEAYAGKTNPISATEESLAQGEGIYATQCASCHGDGGMGDGPAGQATNPPAAPIAHTSQMLGDDYLLWRISEGGAPFNSTMPVFKIRLSEEEQWHVINYVRALGSGQMQPRKVMGGQAYDPQFEKEQRTQMLRQAVEQEVLTMQQAEVFDQVHDAMDELRGSGQIERSGPMNQMQQKMLDALLEQETITDQQAQTFSDAHQKLLDSGLMQ